MKTSIAFLLIFFVLIGSQADAQILRKLKDAAERGVSRAVEKRVESEMEKVAQRQLEKVFGEIYGPEGMPGVNWEKVLSGITADVPVADAYHFTGYSVMELTGKDEKGKDIEPSQIKSFLSDNQMIIGMEIELKEQQQKEGSSILIYDLERNASIILFENEGEKARIAYGLDFEKIAEGIEIEDTDIKEESDSDFTWQKTGRTKNILGYTCEEYVSEDEEGKATYWVTEKPIQGTSSFWGEGNPFLSAKMKQENMDYFKNMPQGNLLEMIFESKTDKSVVQMTVTEINDSAKQTFVMAEYPSAFAGMQEK
ncbi:DUF4412 domain-containing protein [Cecembia lonarensis]|uniref:DUF4412 domain-containing protein n=1 Tax=Cecembia lonarensis (strain CCUG 58316 / KCTC 22772 / LW9) TaxID=1225176 RepID=K1M287_CECL9|nr:DUF4412 domain-containing protein [Cecembia lonarensis]EKB50389.1 hypothetical protein B879_00938 [Cecembia lonarensis LW9]